MKFGIGVILVLGLLVGGSLIVYGIKNDEAGFWMWVGVVIIGVALLFYYMKKLRDNPPSKRLALIPFFLLQDNVVLGDSTGIKSDSVDWGAFILGAILLVVLAGGIYILKRKKPTYAEPYREPVSALDPPLPGNPMDYPPTAEEKRRRQRGKP